MCAGYVYAHAAWVVLLHVEAGGLLPCCQVDFESAAKPGITMTSKTQEHTSVSANPLW